MYDHFLGNFMYRQINNLAPVTIIPEIQYDRDIHTYNTRNANQAYTQFYRKSAVANSFVNKGTVYWLSIPEDIRQSQSIKQFNRFHRNHIFTTL